MLARNDQLNEGLGQVQFKKCPVFKFINMPHFMLN